MRALPLDRGTRFTLLAFDTTPHDLNGTPTPATAQKWTPQGHPPRDDQGIGPWSDEVERSRKVDG